MKIDLKCWHDYYDWTDTKTIQIDTDEYIFFECDWRCGVWHLRGWRYYEALHEWDSEEVSDGGVSGAGELARFIHAANGENKYQPCKVSRFNNLHYAGDFYGELAKLLEMVEKLSEN